jgi:hypothetical protein
VCVHIHIFIYVCVCVLKLCNMFIDAPVRVVRSFTNCSSCACHSHVLTSFMCFCVVCLVSWSDVLQNRMLLHYVLRDKKTFISLL